MEFDVQFKLLFIFCSLVNVNEAYLDESCERLCRIHIECKIKCLQKCNKNGQKLCMTVSVIGHVILGKTFKLVNIICCYNYVVKKNRSQ